SPLYKSELTIDKLNLDDYLGPKGGSTQASVSSSMSTSATVQAIDSSLFPIAALRALRLKGGVKIGALFFNELSFSHIVAKVNADNGVIKLDPLQANLYKGVYKGNLTLNVQGSTPQISMHHAVDHLRSEGLLFDLFEDRYLSGQANLVTDLTARGDSVDALLASLSGTTQLNFKNGTIRDSQFAEKVFLAVNAFEKESIQDGQKVVKFTDLSGTWQVKKGVFSTENLSLLSPYFSIEGQGEANIGSQTLDMLMRIGPKNKGEGKRLYAPLRIKGPFTDLRFSLDMKDLLKTLAQQDIEEAKRKLKEKAEAEKLKLQQKLMKEKEAIQFKVNAEKERAKQRLTAEKNKYQLKWKAEQAQLKEKSKQALNKKLSDEAASQLKQKLNEDAAKKLKKKVESSVDREKLKEVEDIIKDKLEDKFNGLF
ncbi:MAG TPA: AsmA family protein, partial [Thiotrichaceae bacterium]|nr:AsmA family protein [Thiotrichaceae bacterium]